MDLRKELKLSDLLPKRPARKPKRQAKNAARRPDKSTDVVGLKIGATALTAAHVINNGGKKVLRVARAPLAPGIVGGGEVRDPIALGEALANFFAAHSLPRRGVRLGLANSRIGVRVIEIAGIEDEQQLENAIAFRAHEMLSVPVDEAVIDHHVLSVDTGESAEPRAAVAAVNIGHERTTLAISNGVVCDFSRVLQWGGSVLSSAIARALKITPEEGENVKHRLSLEDGHESVDGLPASKSAEATEAVRYELQALVRELVSSLRFYQSQPASLPISEILIAGGTSSIPGLAAELAQELGISVRVADPLTRVQLADGVELPEPAGALAVALGLGIED